jgi:hypothetical protein
MVNWFMVHLNVPIERARMLTRAFIEKMDTLMPGIYQTDTFANWEI